jgi:Bacterial protein of unknown function (DUF899)
VSSLLVVGGQLRAQHTSEPSRRNGNRDIHAPLEKLEAFRKRMGWTFKWLSAGENSFNYDYHVSFKPDEIASCEIFYNYRREKRTMTEHAGISPFLPRPEREHLSYVFMLRARIGHAECRIPFPRSGAERPRRGRLVYATIMGSLSRPIR